MKTYNYSKLEADPYFKKSYLNRTPWWRTILLIPPVCLLFTGLAGILYLFNYDKLVSWYVVPYIVLFALGTMWLKGVRKHICKTAMEGENAFRICIAKPVGEKDGYVYVLFVNNEKRHNVHYISNLVESLPLDDVMSLAAARKKAVSGYDEHSDTSYYIRAYRAKVLNKKNPSWRTEKYFPVLYIKQSAVLVVSSKDLK